MRGGAARRVFAPAQQLYGAVGTAIARAKINPTARPLYGSLPGKKRQRAARTTLSGRRREMNQTQAFSI